MVSMKVMTHDGRAAAVGHIFLTLWQFTDLDQTQKIFEWWYGEWHFSFRTRSKHSSNYFSCILRYNSLTWTKYDYSTGTGYLGTGAEIYQAGFVVDVPGGRTAKT